MRKLNKGVKVMKKLSVLFGVMLLSVLSNITPVSAAGTSIFVSPTGDDANDGSIGAPFRTLEAARDSIRDMKNGAGLPKGGVTVYLRGGDYDMEKVFRLDSRDSGTESAPIKYTAYNNEKVRLLGGVNVTNFEKVSDSEVLSRLREGVRDKAYCADLTGYLEEYHLEEVPNLQPCGVGNWWDMTESSPMLFKNEEMMSYARYPNDGFLTIKSVINEGYFDQEYEDDLTNEHHKMAEFSYGYEDSKKWKNPDDVWIFAYFKYRWSDWFAPANVNTSAQTVRMKIANRASGPTEGKEFYFSNVFEELDTDREFYIDRDTKKLYVISDDIGKDHYELAMMNGGIVSIRDCAYITFENIAMSLSRSNIFTAYNGNHLNLVNCEISKGGTAGVIYNYVKDSKINNNLVCQLGSRGISAQNAGGIAELDVGNVSIENNIVHDFAKLETTYKSAITITGYKNYVGHNEMYNTTHMAFTIQGQDTVFEYNDVHDCLLTSEDAGSVYLGRKWEEVGNIFRYNYIHDLPKGPGGSWRNSAIYFDDGFLGGEVTGNFFENVQCGVFSHGGKDAVVKNNVFINCDEPVNIVDWNFVESSMAYILDRLQTYFFSKSPHWLYYRPEVKAMMENPDNTKPINNTVTNNILFSSGQLVLSEDAKNYGTIEKNIVAADKNIFENFDGGMYTIKKNSPILKQLDNFEVVDFEKIGPVGQVGTITK